jgi:bacterioferritin-associated ferredoxin
MILKGAILRALNVVDNRSHLHLNRCMFVCVCKAVSDKRIHAAVAEGRAVTLRDLTRELSVGTCCGKCVPLAREVLGQALIRQAPPARPEYAAAVAM